MVSRPNHADTNLNLYFGDIHNHCGLSYGHGTLADAIDNARLQLDFTSVTIHAAWPDLPTDEPGLGYLVDYHKQGFKRALANWGSYLEEVERQNEDGRFVTFPSYEWHSAAYGDYCVYYEDGLDSPILDAPDLPSLRQAVKQLRTPALLIPHHIGYRQGSRGINWSTFSSELSPVAEIFSFHGLAEASEGPYPYLHSMGPRHEQSTAQYGWSQGHIFGIIGSSDHHNAFPGSYGYGRLGVWATSLTRHDIWEAIRARRTYALTGDRIDLRFSLNHHVMGSVCPPSPERWLEIAVDGGDAIDCIDVVYNNHLLHRETILPKISSTTTYKVYFELGWGEKFNQVAWDVDIQLEEGRIKAVEPRFRGVGPTDMPEDEDFAYSGWQQPGETRIQFHTKTRPNASLHTATTEGLALEIEGSPQTRVRVAMNGKTHELCLGDLLTGARTFNLGGFVSPALCIHRAVPKFEYTHRFAFLHRSTSPERDWYYVRVRQRNNQWAWSSPIWVESSTSSASGTGT